MYLLDTNVISEMRKVKTGKANANVMAWLGSRFPHDFYINAVIKMELERGILAMQRKDPIQGEYLRRWQQAFFDEFLINPVLPITETTAQLCAKLHVPDHASENDAWIASSAIEHRLMLVTGNTADFKRTGVRLFNPFEPHPH